MKVTGTIYKVMESFTYSDKFAKQEFILEMEDNGFKELIKFQLVNNNRSQLDNFGEGAKVDVTFSLKGREVEKDGAFGYYTNLDAWKIDSVD